MPQHFVSAVCRRGVIRLLKCCVKLEAIATSSGGTSFYERRVVACYFIQEIRAKQRNIECYIIRQSECV